MYLKNLKDIRSKLITYVNILVINPNVVRWKFVIFLQAGNDSQFRNHWDRPFNGKQRKDEK